jgi:SAM-dependent methyltransferase
MTQAHDNWGSLYDYVYEQTYGDFYRFLTVETLDQINQILSSGTIIDYGAGTGRLSIPLSNQDYKVIAVEKSIGMIDELRRKLYGLQHEIELHHCSVSEYKNGNADLAIALFTVFSYSITEEELSTNIKNIGKHLKPEGYFFFDLPNPIFFTSGRLINVQLPMLNRQVELITNDERDVYTYREQCSGIFNENEFSYSDEFKIRYWDMGTLDKLLEENGLRYTLKSFPQFNSTGSTYKLYQKL